MATNAKPATDSLTGYLQRVGGRDILHFADQSKATEAARTIRERHPDVDVDARYEKVFLKLKGTQHASCDHVQSADARPRGANQR